MKFPVSLDQGFPTWGTCTPRGTLLIRRDTFIVQPQQVYLYSSKNLKVILKVQWIFVILLSLFVISNFKGTCSPVQMLTGYMVDKGWEPLL